MFSTIYWIVWLIKMLSMNLRFVLWSVWSRCFWASQILWWILTSTECTICCSSKHLMNSQLNTIHVWNVFNGILNGLTYYNAFIEPLDRFIKCLKKMFLSIPDSVMNSHIYWMYDFLQPNIPNEFPIEYNSCLKSFQRSIEWLDLLQCFHWTIGSLYHVFEVDVFEHPRICDEFSHLLNARFVAAPCI